MLETGAARRPHPQLYCEQTTKIDVRRHDLCRDAIKGKRLADFAGSKHRTVLQRAVLATNVIVCVALSAPPVCEICRLGDTTRGRRRRLTFAGAVSVEDRLDLRKRECTIVKRDFIKLASEVFVRADWRESGTQHYRVIEGLCVGAAGPTQGAVDIKSIDTAVIGERYVRKRIQRYGWRANLK